MDANLGKLLIVDLDETLIYASKERLANPEHFRFDEYYVYKRPLLAKFLQEMSKHFLLGIWSSADDAYVNGIVDAIRPEHIDLEIVWGRSKCSLRLNRTYDIYYYEKRLDKLKKMGFRLEQIIIVDDTHEKSRTNYGNAVHIKPFEGDEADEELVHLEQYLLTLKDVENVREIEKRYWRNKAKKRHSAEAEFDAGAIIIRDLKKDKKTGRVETRPVLIKNH